MFSDKSQTRDERASIAVVINADDYGYFHCVNAGIRAGIEAGLIKAAGLLTTAPAFRDVSARVDPALDIDYGVHLSLSSGQPLTTAMTQRLSRWNGHFPNKWQVTLAMVRGGIPLRAIRDEWAAQIEKALSVSPTLWFLNTHEHLHILPSLREVLLELADQYAVPFVRDLDAERSLASSPTAWSRAAFISILSRTVRRIPGPKAIRCLGLSRSGQLDMGYLRRRFATLSPGRHYELMCHPGHLDPDEVRDPRLMRYHHWEQELALLLSGEFQALCQEFHIVLSRFRDLPFGTKTMSLS